MTPGADHLPDDLDALRAALLAERTAGALVDADRIGMEKMVGNSVGLAL